MQAGANDLHEHRLSGPAFADGARVDSSGKIIRDDWTHSRPHWIFLTVMAEKKTPRLSGALVLIWF
jgi:hypothetical protein